MLWAVLGGVLVSAAFPPLGLYALHWFAYVPLLVALRRASPLAAMFAGGVLGFVLNLLTCWFLRFPLILMLELSEASATSTIVAFCFVSAAPWAAMFAPVPWLRCKRPGHWPLIWALWCLLCEGIYSAFAYVPFSQGISQFRSLEIWQLASIAGGGGVSVLILLANATLSDVIRARAGDRASWRLLLVTGLVACVFVSGHLRIQRLGGIIERGPRLHMLQVQSDRDMAWRSSQSDGALLAYWTAAARAADRSDVDVIVFPEAAIGTDWDRPALLAELWSLSDELDAELLVGTASLGASSRDTFNAVLHFAGPSPTRIEHWRLETLVEAVRSTTCRNSGHHESWTAYELAMVARELVEDDPCRTILAELVVAAEASEGPDASFVVDMLSSVRWRDYAFARALVPEISRSTFERLENGAAWRLYGEESTSPLTVWCAASLPCMVVAPVGRYDKSVPLPFGESRSPLLEAMLDTGRASLRPGAGPITFEVAGRVRVATPICYEAILNDACRAFDRPDVLFNLSNDAWFGNSAGSELHAMLASARAVELGLPLVRASHSGISFVMDPLGRRHAETALFEPVARTVEVPVTRVPTLYRRIGLSGVVFVMCTLIGLLEWRQRSSSSW